MALGLEESLKILDKDEKLDAHLIYSVEKGDLQSYTTEGIKPYFIK